MTQRIICECDRCHREWRADDRGSGLQVFGVSKDLCPICWAAFTEFMRPLERPAADPLDIEDDRTVEEKLRDGDAHLEPDEPYCERCSWPKRLCICAGSSKLYPSPQES